MGARAVLTAYSNVITVQDDVSCETAPATLSYSQYSSYKTPHTLCLDRGSLIFLPDDGTARVHLGAAHLSTGAGNDLLNAGSTNGGTAAWAAGPPSGNAQTQNTIADNTGTMYEIQKIYMAKPTALHPDYTQTIVLDKNVNWGTALTGNLMPTNTQANAALDAVSALFAGAASDGT